MKRLTLLIIVLLTATLSCSGKAEGCQCQDAADDFQKEKIASIAPKQNRNNNVAMLSNTRSTYRLCNTRPQRLLPTYSSNPAKTQGKNHFYSSDIGGFYQFFCDDLTKDLLQKQGFTGVRFDPVVAYRKGCYAENIHQVVFSEVLPDDALILDNGFQKKYCRLSLQKQCFRM